MTVVAVVPIRVTVTLVEVKVVRVVGIALVRRSTPVVTVCPLVVGRRTVTPTGGRYASPAAIYTEK